MPKRDRHAQLPPDNAAAETIIRPTAISRLLTDQEIIELLHISRTMLFRLMNHPVRPMPYIKFFTSLRFDANDVGTWLQEWKKYTGSEHVDDLEQVIQEDDGKRSGPEEEMML